MPTGSITKTTVDKAQAPTNGAWFLWDDKVKGFGLRVTAGGTKTYVFQYRMGGRGSPTRRYSIGSHGNWTPDQARDRAKELGKLVDSGTDPIKAEIEAREEAERAEAEKEKAEADAVNLKVDALTSTFVDDCLKNEWKAWEDGERNLKLHVLPILDGKSVRMISMDDVNRILDKLADRPAARYATVAVLRKFIGWAQSKGHLTIKLPSGEVIVLDPLRGVKRPKPPKKRQRFLSEEELAAVWHATFRLGGLYAGPIRFLCLTGQRQSEVGRAPRGEVNIAQNEWMIDGSRTKNKLANFVPLSPLMIDIIKSVSRPGAKLLFSKNGKSPPNGWSSAKARFDPLVLAVLKERAVDRGENPEHVEMKHWTWHDLRRTVSTLLSKCAVSTEVVEALLNHISGTKGGVAGTYKVYEYAPEKRAAIAKWDRFITEIVTSNPAHSSLVAV